MRGMDKTIESLNVFKDTATAEIEKLLQQNAKDGSMREYVSSIPVRIGKAENSMQHQLNMIHQALDQLRNQTRPAHHEIGTPVARSGMMQAATAPTA